MDLHVTPIKFHGPIIGLISQKLLISLKTVTFITFADKLANRFLVSAVASNRD